MSKNLDKEWHFLMPTLPTIGAKYRHIDKGHIVTALHTMMNSYMWRVKYSDGSVGAEWGDMLLPYSEPNDILKELLK